MHRQAIALALGALLAIASPVMAQAQPANPNDWVDKRVVLKSSNVALRIENHVVERSRKSAEIYRVEQVTNGWLWLKVEGNGIAGWAAVNDVVPLDDAITFLTNELRANPNNAASYQMRAWLWFHVKKEYDIALGDCNEALRISPNANSYNCRGALWHTKKEYDKAIADFSEAIRLDPNDAGHYYNRGLAWHDKKEYAKAIADYNEAIRLDPAYALAYINRGNAWRDKKEYAKAIADYNEAIRLDPKFALAYHNRGAAFHYKKDYDKAIADYSEAIGLQPYNGKVFMDRAAEWEAKKDYDKAIADYSEAIRLDPKLAWAHYSRALTNWLTLSDDKALSGSKETLEAGGWRGELSSYAAILGHFAARRSGKPDEATKFLDDFQAKGDMTAWPAPVVRYLKGEIDEKALLAASTDNDKLTESHAFAGIDLLSKRKTDEAKTHFLWVKERGNPGSPQYTISLAELDRLEKTKDAGTKP